MNVIIKVFRAGDSDKINEAQGELEGLGYHLTRLRVDKGMDCVDETVKPPVEHHFEDVVLLIATA